MGHHNWSRRIGVAVEWLFAVAIILCIIGLVRDVLIEGYLPSPFFYAKPETFTDWYNPAYWANNPGAYSEWRSVYPPFTFVFLRLFSRSSCYLHSAYVGRDCDPQGYLLLTLLTLVNFILAWLTYRKVDKFTAFPRALAVGLGLPVLFAWERGNLNIACFTALILGYGNLLRSARLKAFFAAIAFNFKPYIILAVAGRLVRRDWVWLEWFGLFIAVIYAASFAAFGAGDPMTLLNDILGFTHTPDNLVSWDLIDFTTTYNGLMAVFRSTLPIIAMTGSAPVEALEHVIPILIRLGEVGVLACLAYMMWHPMTSHKARISALPLLLFMSISLNPGGYAAEFALFFVFFESWRGPGRILALAAAYLWCMPFDFPIVTLFHEFGFSFLSQRAVQYDRDITVGQLVRPGLLLLIQYGLVWASAGDILRDLRSLRRARVAIDPGRALQPG